MQRLWLADGALEKTPRVLIHRGAFTDQSRAGRTVPFKLYYPDEDGSLPLPVVFWSHGLGGSREGAGFLSRFLAGHGYVVVHVQHPGTDSALWEGKPGHPWDVIRATKIPRKTVLDRYRDVPFVLDRLKDWAQDNPQIGQKMDFSRIGMSGHSFGANTTQILAGQQIGRGARAYRLHDPRFRAGILYSPIPAYNRDEGLETVYGGLSIPLLHMTGTKDESPLEGFGWERRREVFEHSGAPGQYFMALKEGDHMVFAGSRGKLGGNPLRETHEDLIRLTSLAFWDAYLRGDEVALAWLRDGGVQDWLEKRALFMARQNP